MVEVIAHGDGWIILGFEDRQQKFNGVQELDELLECAFWGGVDHAEYCAYLGWETSDNDGYKAWKADQKLLKQLRKLIADDQKLEELLQ